MKAIYGGKKTMYAGMAAGAIVLLLGVAWLVAKAERGRGRSAGAVAIRGRIAQFVPGIRLDLDQLSEADRDWIKHRER